MTTPAPPAAGRQDFYGTSLRPEQTLQLVNAIVAGGQFAGTLTRQGTNMASVVFPVLTGVEEPEWTEELAVIPTLGLDGEPLVVAPSRQTVVAGRAGELRRRHRRADGRGQRAAAV